MHLVHLYIWKQDFLSFMLYKFYVNLCDFRAVSQELHNFISTCHWDDACQIVLHLMYWFIRRRFLNNIPF